MYIEYNYRYPNRKVFTRMININDIITSTQFAAAIALIATAIIVVVLRPPAPKSKHRHSR